MGIHLKSDEVGRKFLGSTTCGNKLMSQCHQGFATIICLWLVSTCGCQQQLPNNTERPIAAGLVAPQPEQTPEGQLPIEYTGGHFPSELKTPNPIKSIFFIGNSHTSNHGLPQIVKAMLEAGGLGQDIKVEVSAGPFLDQHLTFPTTQEKFQRQAWEVVVLQAQQYSQSGKYAHLYPIAPAVEWVKRVKDQGGLPIMYPEWAQVRGGDEGMTTYRLHCSIAEQQAARVAPIGQAWYRAIHEDPKLELHAGDGNHSSPAGAYLTACVLYATISQKSPLELPDLKQVKLAPKLQKQLRQYAHDSLPAGSYQ